MIYDLNETPVMLHSRIKFLFEASVFPLQVTNVYRIRCDTALSSILPGIKRNGTIRDWGIRGVHIFYLYSNYILS